MHYETQSKDGAILVLSGSDFPHWIDLISPNYILLMYMLSSRPAGSSDPQATIINHQVKPHFFLDCFYKESLLPETRRQPDLALSTDVLACGPSKASLLFPAFQSGLYHSLAPPLRVFSSAPCSVTARDKAPSRLSPGM